MSKYIYEMVTFGSWEAENPSHFFIEYHFEDFFTSRQSAINYTRKYIDFLLENKIAVEAVELNLNNKSKSQLVLYMVQNEEITEFYGINRNIILN